jgi:hypothetical protein
MKTAGKVAAGNPQRGLYAVQTDQGFTIVEDLFGDIDVGDLLVWRSGWSLGEETYWNETKQTEAEVYVQNHGVGRATLRAQLRL